MRTILLRPLSWLYCLYAFLVFVTGMLIILPLIAIASLFGPQKGGNAIYRICYAWGWTWMTLIGIFYRSLPGNAPTRGKSYVFVANHIAYLDIPVIFRTIRRHHFRILGKIELKDVPVFGYIYRQAVILVDRSSAAKRSQSVRILKQVLQQGISVFIFPEGTFNETGRPLKEFYDGAFRVAIETGTPVKPMLFLDTYRRMHYRSVLSLNPGPCRAVFLPEIPVTGLELKDLPELRDRVFAVMEKALIEHRAAWIDSSKTSI